MQIFQIKKHVSKREAHNKHSFSQRIFGFNLLDTYSWFE